jgi:thymidylate synthase ThyX
MGRQEFEPLDPKIEKLPKSPLPKVEILGITTAPLPEELPEGVTLEDFKKIASSPTIFAGESARTCYSSKGICRPIDYLNPEHRKITDQVIESIRKAGHLTPWQNFEIVFGLSNVSRQLIWSFLHIHPFYNSEEVSQRYVAVKEGNFFIPPLEGKALELYLENTQEQMKAYNQLKDLLSPIVAEEYFKIFPKREGKEKYQKSNESTIEKKSQEVARYVLGVDTFSYFHHTINPLTLMRYYRTCSITDVPTEAKLVVYEMVNQIEKFDPQFLKELEDPYPLEKTPEFEALTTFRSSINFSAAKEFTQEFDRNLDGKISKLTDWYINGEKTIAQAVKNVLGLSKNRLSDTQAIELVLNPKNNKILGDVLNLTTLDKVAQALHTISYTFEKKISHTADSQDQRHRTTPAARPILATHYSGKPDYITSTLIKQSPEALKLYQEIMEKTFKTINQLLEMGIPREYALYRLPNAFPIRFTETGSLLNLHHKYKMRLCFNAQEEIWQASVQETQQISKVHPQIGKWLLAPCGLRWSAHTTPYCPEGERYCGRPVWNKNVEDYPPRII